MSDWISQFRSHMLSGEPNRCNECSCPWILITGTHGRSHSVDSRYHVPTDYGHYPAMLERRLRQSEVVLWCAILTVLLVVRLVTAGPSLSNDGYQYLSEAGNIRSGNGFSTSIVHFDEEQSHGRIPAPLTTFPPGYPVMIALMSHLRLSLRMAAVICSALSAIALVPLTVLLCQEADLDRNGTRFALAILEGNFLGLTLGTGVNTDALFTCLSCSAVIACWAGLRPGNSPSRTTVLLFVCGILVGAAYWVRYAAIFFLLALIAFILLQAVLARSIHLIARALPLLSALLFIGPLMLRNYLVVGSWRGGNTKPLFTPAQETAKTILISIHQALFAAPRPALGFGELCLYGGMVLLAWTFVRSPVALRIRPAHRVPGLIIMYTGMYIALLAYVGSTSAVGLTSRYFYPLVPLWAVGLGLVVQPVWSTSSSIPRLAAIAVLTGYLAMNSRGLMSTKPPDFHQNLEVRLQSSIPGNGGTVQDWIHSNIPHEAVITASCGQATGYLLGHPTLSLVDRRYSRQEWQDAYLIAAMDRFHARWLILYPQAECAFEQRDWPNLERLAHGDTAPGLTLAVKTSEVAIFRR